jgi:uncharacterized membrane protein
VVRAPAKLKKGRTATVRVTVSNSGDAAASGVRLKVSGRGISAGVRIGSVGAGGSRTVKAKVKPRASGKIRTSFRVTSENAAGKTVKKTLTVTK